MCGQEWHIWQETIQDLQKGWPLDWGKTWRGDEETQKPWFFLGTALYLCQARWRRKEKRLASDLLKVFRGSWKISATSAMNSLIPAPLHLELAGPKGVQGAQKWGGSYWQIRVRWGWTFHLMIMFLSCCWWWWWWWWWNEKMNVRLLRKSLCFNTRMFSMWLWCRANGFEINFLFALHGGWMSFCSCRIMADNLASHWTNVERLMKFVHCMCIARCYIALRSRYLVVHNQNIKQAWHYNQGFFLIQDMFLIVFVQARGLWHLCRYIWERFRLPQHHHWKRWGPSQIHVRSISHECCMMLNDCLLQAAFADLIRAQLEKHQQVVLSPAILMLEALPLWNIASKARFIAEGYREALEIPDFHRFPLNLIREGGKCLAGSTHVSALALG